MIGNDVTVTVQGFKGFNRKGLTLSAAQVMRIDIPLEVGSSICVRCLLGPHRQHA